jgi:hypothetical protein
MSVTIIKKKGDKGGMKTFSFGQKSDYMAVEDLKTGKISVVHESVGKNIIKKKLFVERKDVDFEVGKPHIKFIEIIETKSSR